MIYHECPLCDGDGRLEYERPVIDWVHGGYLEGYMDDCEKCKGEGEVTIEFSFLTWVKERWDDERFDNPKACLKTWFKRQRQVLLDEWRQEVGLVIS